MIDEHTHNTGGTGIIVNTNKHIMIPNAKTKLLEQIRDQGRVGLYGVEYSKGCIAYFYVIYGHTNGDSAPLPDPELMRSANVYLLKLLRKSQGLLL